LRGSISALGVFCRVPYYFYAFQSGYMSRYIVWNIFKYASG
jgi:hypothetical protein